MAQETAAAVAAVPKAGAAACAPLEAPERTCRHDCLEPLEEEAAAHRVAAGADRGTAAAAAEAGGAVDAAGARGAASCDSGTAAEAAAPSLLLRQTDGPEEALLASSSPGTPTAVAAAAAAARQTDAGEASPLGEGGRLVKGGHRSTERTAAEVRKVEAPSSEGARLGDAAAAGTEPAAARGAVQLEPT